MDELIAHAWPEETDSRWTNARRRHAGRGRRGIPVARSPRSRIWNGRRTRRRLASSRALRDQPGQRAPAADLHRRLRADGLRHRRDHGCARRTTSATGSSPTAFGLPIVRSHRPARATSTGCRRRRHRRAGYVGDGTLVNSDYLDGLDVETANATVIAGSRPTATARAPSSTSCGTGCSPASGTGANRSPSSTTMTAARRAAGNRCCRWNCRKSKTSRRCPSIRTTRTRAVTAAGQGTDWVEVDLDLGDGLQQLPPRHQRDAAMGGQFLVPAALHRSDELGGASAPRRTRRTG